MLRAIAPGVRSRAWQLALGWPVGLSLEILAFSLTAALGIRDGFLAYPLLVGVSAALIWRRRARGGDSDRSTAALFSPRSRWALAGLCLLAFAYIGIAYYAITPLPGTVGGVVYPGDMTFQIAVAGSALHGWPAIFPGVSGQPFHYHYFIALHMAAIAQVTDIHLPLIVFRLYLLPLTALLVLQLGLAGRLIAGRSWAGPLVVGLFLLIREIDLSVSDILPFGGTSGLYHLWASPSQLLGMNFFVAILLVLALLLDPEIRERASPHLGARRGELLIVLAVLVAAAGGAKVVVLPLLIGGLALYLLWVRLRDSRIDSVALGVLALCVIAFAAYYLLLYRGGEGIKFDPPGTIEQMMPLDRVHEAWPGGWLAGVLFWALAVPIGTLAYFGPPLFGMFWFLRRRGSALPPVAILSLSLLVTGAAAFFFLQDEHFEQLYMTLYGLTAALPLVAIGLITFFEEQARQRRLDLKAVGVFAVVWLAAMILLAKLGDLLWVHGHPLEADLLTYLSVAILVAALAVAAARSAGPRRALLASWAVLAVLLVAALDVPLDILPYRLGNLRDGKPLYATSPAGLRPREFEGMEWIRDHLDEDAVLAVSNDRTRRTRILGPWDNDYPAFTEHRTFREGWAYTLRANQIGQDEVGLGHKDPFPERTALEQAVFTRADPSALRTMVERYGVTDIVVSRKDGAVNPRLYRLGRLVYSNGAVDVIALSEPASR